MALANNQRYVVSDATGGGAKSVKTNYGDPYYTHVDPMDGSVMEFYRAPSLNESSSSGGATGTPTNAIVKTPVQNTNSNSGSTVTYVYGGGGYDPSSLYKQMLEERQALMQKNYDAMLGQLKSAYDSSVNSLKNQGADAMREAYINMMMNKRGLNQDLTRGGINGGAAESVMANLYNTYANDRNKIARTLNESLEEAGRNYGNNVANLGINYNNDYSGVLNDYYSQLAAAKMSLANQLQPITTRTSSNTSTTPTTVAATTPTVNRSSVINSLRGYNSYDDALAALGAMNLNLSTDDWAAIIADLQSMYPTAKANVMTGNQGGYVRNGVTNLTY